MQTETTLGAYLAQAKAAALAIIGKAWNTPETHLRQNTTRQKAPFAILLERSITTAKVGKRTVKVGKDYKDGKISNTLVSPTDDGNPLILVNLSAFNEDRSNPKREKLHPFHLILNTIAALAEVAVRTGNAEAPVKAPRATGLKAMSPKQRVSKLLERIGIDTAKNGTLIPSTSLLAEMEAQAETLGPLPEAIDPWAYPPKKQTNVPYVCGSQGPHCEAFGKGVVMSEKRRENAIFRCKLHDAEMITLTAFQAAVQAAKAA